MWNLTSLHVLTSTWHAEGFLNPGKSGKGSSTCLGAAIEEHTWTPKAVSLQDLERCVHLEKRGQAVQHHPQLQNPPRVLRAGSVQEKKAISH